FLILAIITFLLTILLQPFFKPFLSLIPLLLPIILPYLLPIFIPIVKFHPIISPKSIHFPHIYLPFKHYLPSFHLPLLLVIIPILFLTLTEHIRHQMVFNKILRT
ncbi:solute carrier family 23 protein, partial [Staphylococcus aureus]|uniref:solute carrier family 23 protein n=1 Tax=Staphylococcus aureus TaxID=1280 RepID=UPI0028CB8BE1